MDSQHRYAYVVNNSGAALQGGVLQYAIDKHKGSLSVVQAPDDPPKVVVPYRLPEASTATSVGKFI